MGCYKVSPPTIPSFVNLVINRFSRKQKKTTLSHIPRDILEDILLRLPLKSVFKCARVSRFWYSVVKDHLFIDQLNRKHRITGHKLMISRGTVLCSIHYEAASAGPRAVQTHYIYNIIKEPWCTTYGTTCSIRIWGHCKGIMCLSSIKTKAVFLWNPYTRACRKIRNSTNADRLGYWSVMYAVGYDSATHDYIVVGVFSSKTSESHSEVEVYTSGKNAWRRMKDVPYGIRTSKPGQFVNGSFYWVAERDSRPVVVNYHFETEKAVEVTLPVPDYVDQGCQRVTVASLDGCLCVVFHHPKRDVMRRGSEGWIMKKESWVNLFCIEDDDNVVPLSFVNNGAELYVMGDKRGLYLYRIDRKTIREFEIQDYPKPLVDATIYTESVVPL